MPLVQTRGAASAQGFGEFAKSGPVNYIEEVFSTQVYTGAGTSKIITNNIDLSTKGGLVWTKMRTSPASNAHDHRLSDSAIGVNQVLSSNNTNPKTSSASFGITSFNVDGYTITNSSGDGGWNYTNDTFVSWTFRKQPKFFDVVTYTGTGSAQTIAHSLGSVPGCIIVKRTNTTSNWRVYHRSLTSAAYMVALNQSAGEAIENGAWNSTAPTSSVFTVGSASEVNASGSTYVAYVFAHNAGGFGLLGTDNVISCGSFTTNGSGVASVNLGYEPQWVVAKAVAGGTGSWVMQDNMRGFTASPTVYTANPLLFANNADSEATFGASTLQANATGFTTVSATYDPSVTYIYIAIRRGPMKVPTVGTSVFQPIAYTGNGTSQSITTGITGDLTYIKYRTDGGASTFFFDRLRNPKAYLESNSTVAEVTGTQHITAFNQLGFSVGNNGNVNDSGGTFISQTFKRAPSFFDEVCYTGTGANTTFTHNLGVVPELMIVKRRDANGDWDSYSSALANTEYVVLSTTAAKATGATRWNSTTPTSSVFSVGTSTTTNASAGTYVAYLFATCAGVSKVGSYTGTGTTLQVNCGFTAGARFVLIKRTDSTGDWYVWDSARGIIAGNDPYLLLNSTAAEVTSTDYIDTYNAGFEISSTAPAAINASAGTFIFLAIA